MIAAARSAFTLGGLQRAIMATMAQPQCDPANGQDDGDSRGHEAPWTVEREIATLIALTRGQDRLVAAAAHRQFRWRLGQCALGPDWAMGTYRVELKRRAKSRRRRAG